VVRCTVEDIKKISTEIALKLDACDNGEGVGCATLDDSLDRCARLYCELVSHARQWARQVFSGELQYDPSVERAWQQEGAQLYQRAVAMWQRGRQAAVECYDLPGRQRLQASLWQLHRLLTDWVTPKLSIGPAARHPLAPEIAKAAAARVAELPPLPMNWEPQDQTQRTLYRKTKSS
jgi:hypothetical protein